MYTEPESMKPFLLFFLFLLYVPLAQADSVIRCSEVFKVNRGSAFFQYNSSELGGGLIQFQAYQKGYRFRITFPKALSTVDPGLFAIILNTFQVKQWEIEFHNKRISAFTEKGLTPTSARILKRSFDSTVRLLQNLTVSNFKPESVSSAGGSDKFDALMDLKEEYSPATATDAFVDTYVRAINSYRTYLPLALRAAFSTEYFLIPILSQQTLAVRLVQSAYGVSAKRAIQVLAAMEKAFLDFYLKGTPPKSEILTFGLGSHYAYTFPTADTKSPRRIFQDPPTVDAVYHRPHRGNAYRGHFPREDRHLLIDDLPHQFIGIDSILFLKEELKILTIEQFAEVTIGPRLMEILQLDRTSLREFYDYMLVEYGVRLNIYDDLAGEIGIH